METYFSTSHFTIDKILSADATRLQIMNVLCELAAFKWNTSEKLKFHLQFSFELNSDINQICALSEIHVENLIKMWKIKRRNAIKKNFNVPPTNRSFHQEMCDWSAARFFTQLFLSSQKSIQRLRTKYLYGNSALESIVCIRQLKRQHSFAKRATSEWCWMKNEQEPFTFQKERSNKAFHCYFNCCLFLKRLSNPETWSDWECSNTLYTIQ